MCQFIANCPRHDLPATIFPYAKCTYYVFWCNAILYCNLFEDTKMSKQTTQWPKEKGQNGKQQYTKHYTEN